MFPYPIAKPQKCDIQTFVGSGSNATNNQYSWTKPVGVSHVYMLLIGSGRGGNGTTGGGSGAVTVFYCAAQHIPNTLYVWVGPAPTTSYITIDPKGLVSYLTAQAGSTPPTGGAATAAPALAASGFYKSTAGQDGSAGGQTASSTTFLSGGAILNNSVVANYGYTNANNAGSGQAGFFQMQPIIVGVGASGPYDAGIGCGGGVTGKGGPGMVLIASW